MHLINKPDTEYTGQETYVSSQFVTVGDRRRREKEEEKAICAARCYLDVTF